jgi:small subunit ribosomal protein S16
MVCIRLMRMGAKKRPYYRVVVADSRRFRDGKFIEKVGSYDPLPESPKVELNMERVDYWMQKGARPSETVRNLISGVRKSATTIS